MKDQNAQHVENHYQLEQVGMEKEHTSASTGRVKTDSKLLMQELYPHQRLALTQLDDGKILYGGVGSGKTRVAVAYYELNHPHRDIIVITTAKKRDTLDWEKEFALSAIGKEKEFSAAGKLTVDSWNNLHKYVDKEDVFFIFDEQRLVGTGRWVRAFLKISKKNKWIMLSATPGDTWLDYGPVFIANGHYKNITEFRREHVVYRPMVKFPIIDRYINESRLIKLKANILVHMPYPKPTKRYEKTIYVDYSEKLLDKVLKERWHIYADRPIRDIAELWLVMRRVINSDTSRLKALRSLLRKHLKLIVFYNFDYELELLRGLCDVTEVAELNGHNHDDIPDTDSWVYLVQYVAGSEAWNCTETNAIAFYSLTYSYKNWEQAHGRIDRLDTPFIDLYYYVLRSKSFVDSAILRKLKRKENFNVNRAKLPEAVNA